MLESLCCEPCGGPYGADCGQSWARVWTVREGRTHISELSWPLARRIVPKLAARHGITDENLWTGQTFLIRTPEVLASQRHPFAPALLLVWDLEDILRNEG